MYKFGNKSKQTLITANKYLVLCAIETIKKSKIDLSVPPWGGLRTPEYQKELYDKGWSKADGYNKLSNHQKVDNDGYSLALDLCAYYNGGYNWNTERLCYIAGLMLSTFDELKGKGLIPDNKYIHWGGFWSSDDDGMGWDLPHYEIKDSPQNVKV